MKYHAQCVNFRPPNAHNKASTHNPLTCWRYKSPRLPSFPAQFLAIALLIIWFLFLALIRHLNNLIDYRSGCKVTANKGMHAVFCFAVARSALFTRVGGGV